MKRWLLIALAAVIVAIAVVRVQPAGSVTLYRTGNEIIARRTAIFVRPLTTGDACRAQTLGGDIVSESSPFMITATGDEFTADVRILYEPPQTIKGVWPSGDWCSSLKVVVARAANAASSRVNADAVIANVRDVDHAIADAIASDLAKSGVAVKDVKALLSVPAGFERVHSTPAASLARTTRPVLFIGLDGADWELLDDYMQAGAMPVLARLVREGSGGVLETEQPPLSPLVWTTMFTGVSPLDHEILDFTRFNPYTRTREPITSDERRVPAIWNMETYAGKSTAVFGVWGTYAAEPVHGLNVSDRLFTFLYAEKQLPPAAVYPDGRSAWANGNLHASEQRVDVARMREYLPWISDAEYTEAARAEDPYAQPASALRRILVETDVYRHLALDYLGTRTLPDLSIVYLQGTDTIGHIFAPFAPPRQPQIAQSDYDKYSAVPAHYFRDIDALLGEFVKIAERNGAVVVIASDHGFRWREGRPVALSSFAAASAAKWHRNEGIFVMWGPGIHANPGHPLKGGVRQLCATLAALTGIPAAAGTATAPLPGLAVDRTIDYRQWFQRAASPPRPSANASNEDIAKLKALGYIGSNESATPQAPTTDTKTAGAYNNAGLIQRSQNDVANAIRSFERAIELDPHYASAKWNLSETLFDHQQQLDRSDTLLVEAVKNGLPDGTRLGIGRSIAYQRSGQAGRALNLVDALVTASGNDADLRLFRGRYRMEQHDCQAARDDFQTAVRLRPDATGFASLGLASMCLGDQAAARAAFEQSLRIDPNQPMLRQMLGQ